MEIKRKYKDGVLAEIDVETPDTTTTTLHFEQGKLKKLLIWGKDGNSVSAIFDKDRFYYSAEGNPGACANDGILGLNLNSKECQKQFRPICQLITNEGHLMGIRMFQEVRTTGKDTDFVHMATITSDGQVIKEKEYERRVSCKDVHLYSNPLFFKQLENKRKR